MFSSFWLSLTAFETPRPHCPKMTSFWASSLRAIFPLARDPCGHLNPERARWAHLACLVSQSRQNSLNIATDSNIIIKSIIITTIVIDMMITIINMSTTWVRWGGAWTPSSRSLCLIPDLRSPNLYKSLYMAARKINEPLGTFGSL